MSRLHACAVLSMLSSILLFSGTAAADDTCTLVCPANANLATAPGGASVPYSWTITPVGTCGGVVQTAGLPSGSNFAVGTTTQVFQATDPPNQTCLFSVTVTATPANAGPHIAVPALGPAALAFLSLALGWIGLGATRRSKKT